MSLFKPFQVSDYKSRLILECEGPADSWWTSAVAEIMREGEAVRVSINRMRGEAGRETEREGERVNERWGMERDGGIEKERDTWRMERDRGIEG